MVAHRPRLSLLQDSVTEVQAFFSSATNKCAGAANTSVLRAFSAITGTWASLRFRLIRGTYSLHALTHEFDFEISLTNRSSTAVHSILRLRNETFKDQRVCDLIMRLVIFLRVAMRHSNLCREDFGA